MTAYIVVDVASKMCDSKCMSLIGHGLEVVDVSAVLVVQLVQ